MRYLSLIVLSAVLAGPATLASAGDEVPEGGQTPYGYKRPVPKEGYQYPECFCTDSQGQRVELGQTTCLQIGSSQVFARCGMSLNNPTWRRLSEGCPTS